MYSRTICGNGHRRRCPLIHVEVKRENKLMKVLWITNRPIAAGERRYNIQAISGTWMEPVLDALKNRSDLVARMELYIKSIQVFFNNFLAGGFWVGQESGGHSALLDYAARTGIIGLSVLVATFAAIYKFTILKFKALKQIGLIYFAQVLFFIYAILNTAFQAAQFWLLFGLSAGCCMLLQEKQKFFEMQNEEGSAKQGVSLYGMQE